MTWKTISVTIMCVKKNVTCAENVFFLFHFVRYKKITLKSYINFLQHDLSCEKHSCHLCRLCPVVNNGYLLVEVVSCMDFEPITLVFILHM
jgi:hypothetical protein